jgi:hypothetical protein
MAFAKKKITLHLLNKHNYKNEENNAAFTSVSCLHNSGAGDYPN